MWICQANHFDLEYYNYVLLAAKSKYLKNLEKDFSNFYEIVFHYLNLNTIIADKSVYDSHLNKVSSHKNLDTIILHLTNVNEAEGKEIVKMAHEVLAGVLKEYLSRQILALEHLSFQFNNLRFHKEKKIYLIARSLVEKYEIYELSETPAKVLGYKLTKKSDLYLPEVFPGDLTNRIHAEDSSLIDLDHLKNSIIISGTDRVLFTHGITITKDLILLNKLMNPKHGFDPNLLLDYDRFLETKQSIPFKLKV
jgi:hypothetical protein